MIDDFFVLYSILSLILLGLIAWRIWRSVNNSPLRLFQFPVICSISLFFFGFFLPFLRYIFEESWFEFRHLIPASENFYWLSFSLCAVILAHESMWIGYGSKTAVLVGTAFRRALVQAGILKQQAAPSIIVLLCIFLISIGVRVVCISLGIYGYVNNANRLNSFAYISQFLWIASSAGRISLFLLAFRAFVRKTDARSKELFLLIPIVSTEVFFGMMSGFKSQVFMPIATMLAAYYLARGRISLALSGVLAFSIICAYVIVEPLRRLAYTNQITAGDLNELVNAVTMIAQDNLEGGNETNSFSLFRLQERLDLLNYTAVAFHFANHDSASDSSHPDFFQEIVLVPVSSFVPRFLWESKAVVNDGRWFSTAVLGMPSTVNTSTAMGPVAYLYFAGGLPAIPLLFLLIGLLQRATTEAFSNAGLSGILIIVGLVPVIGLIETNVSSVLTHFIRYFVVLLATQRVIMISSPKEGLSPAQV